MPHTSSEREKIARVWRAGRLLAGLTQNQLAKALEIPQSSISKYETMNLEPSASDWFHFCQYVGIDAHKALNLGYIDSKTKFKSKLYSTSLFNVPIRYRRDFSMKIREFIPIKEVIIREAGVKLWEKFVKAHDIEAEMFHVYDFQISYQLFLDLVAWTKENSLDVLSLATDLAGSPDYQGLVSEQFATKTDPTSLMKKFSEIQGYYQNAVTTDFQISSQEATLSMHFHPAILEFFDLKSLLPFRDYKANSFAEIMSAQIPSFGGFQRTETESSLTLKTEIA